MTASIEHILRRAERLAADRGAFESRWREVRELVLPAAAGFGTVEAAGAPNRSAILDSSGEQANELLAAALHGMLTNPSAKWFALRVRDDRLNQDEAVARWLEQASGTLCAVFASPESQNARKPGLAPGFPAKSMTSPPSISPFRLPLARSSRASNYRLCTPGSHRQKLPNQLLKGRAA